MTQFSFTALRKKHPRFIYKTYTVSEHGNDFVFQFEFLLEPDMYFRPTVTFHDALKQRGVHDRFDSKNIANFAFHIGLAEMLSYWKAACSPEIVIEAGFLNDEQLLWWKNLLLSGMGEFFYKNNIDFTPDDFVHIVCTVPAVHTDIYKAPVSSEVVLIPVGGGKDSVVTTELMKKSHEKVGLFMLNPTQAALDIASKSGIKDVIKVSRTLDKKLFELNAEGYLNGHTPFSSYLAFVSTVSAALFGYSAVAISQERSSNEGNVLYRNVEINHQYSKSFAFEKDFRAYTKQYITPSVDFFSFLRPLFEVQIARMFLRFNDYFFIFRSCNKGQKTNTWCHACSKCLFIFTSLFPFLEEDILTKKIFTRNLFEDSHLVDEALALVGATATKPFECLGTIKETKVAFYLCWKKYKDKNAKPPVVLEKLYDKVLKNESRLDAWVIEIFSSWDDEHFLSKDFSLLLKKETHI